MKYLIIFAALIAVTLMASTCVQAQPAPPVPRGQGDTIACYSINDPDMRTMCLAVVRREPSRCYAITAPDVRALCRAKAQ